MTTPCPFSRDAPPRQDPVAFLVDPWTDATIAFANSATFVDSRGSLDASGSATAKIVAGPTGNSSLIGVVLYHAYVVYDASSNFYTASNPVPLLIAK